MSPEIALLTVQVRVRPALPASTGTSSDTTVFTFRESLGTGVRDYYHGRMLHTNIPVTCISIVSVYIASPATAIHVNSCPCKSSFTRGMVYSNTVRFIALLMFNSDDWSIHSIESIILLLIQLMVAFWPTGRGSSRPDIVMISVRN